MSTIAVGGRAFGFYRAMIGKKVLVAATGVVMFGYLVGHLAGNLLIFQSREALDAYGAFLHASPGLLWGTRIILLLSVAMHIVASLQLARLKQIARPVGYRKYEPIASSYASRTMLWSGPMIAAFVVYHLLHFTFGVVHPFEPGRVYDNMVRGFSQAPVSAAYIVAMVLLGMHLYHGLWSMFQTLGVSHPRYTPVLRRGAAIVAVLLIGGFISIPVAVLTGIVHL